MKRLTVTYAGRKLFDGDIAEFTWTENDTDITVKGRTTQKPSLAETLRSAASKQRTAPPVNGLTTHRPGAALKTVEPGS